mmetsp:Transcript_103009/g.297890  ORF Transcript_103009/g.297890 Transcript_103009/m.297890 type:complete len:345 (-) Transcript_103009:801-1835(-)
MQHRDVHNGMHNPSRLRRSLVPEGYGPIDSSGRQHRCPIIAIPQAPIARVELHKEFVDVLLHLVLELLKALGIHSKGVSMQDIYQDCEVLHRDCCEEVVATATVGVLLPTPHIAAAHAGVRIEELELPFNHSLRQGGDLGLAVSAICSSLLVARPEPPNEMKNPQGRVLGGRRREGLEAWVCVGRCHVGMLEDALGRETLEACRMPERRALERRLEVRHAGVAAPTRRDTLVICAVRLVEGIVVCPHPSRINAEDSRPLRRRNRRRLPLRARVDLRALCDEQCVAGRCDVARCGVLGPIYGALQGIRCRVPVQAVDQLAGERVLVEGDHSHHHLRRLGEVEFGG